LIYIEGKRHQQGEDSIYSNTSVFQHRSRVKYMKLRYRYFKSTARTHHISLGIFYCVCEIMLIGTNPASRS
jgi:hypothetical protein